MSLDFLSQIKTWTLRILHWVLKKLKMSKKYENQIEIGIDLNQIWSKSNDWSCGLNDTQCTRIWMETLLLDSSDKLSQNVEILSAFSLFLSSKAWYFLVDFVLYFMSSLLLKASIDLKTRKTWWESTLTWFCHSCCRVKNFHNYENTRMWIFCKNTNFVA